MATGFIYVVNTVTPDYAQPAFCNVPTEFDGRLYFGPCKRPMRPRMRVGDWIFGVSPSCTAPRRIVFAAEIEEAMTFAEAYHRFADLRGPEGPIHVRPVRGSGEFPQSDYRHIAGSMHPDEWTADLANPDLDRFFVCRPDDGWLGRWLGPDGPEVNTALVTFLNACVAYGAAGQLGRNTGTVATPIAYGNLYTGLHLETEHPEELIRLCELPLTPARVNERPAPRRRGVGQCRR